MAKANSPIYYKDSRITGVQNTLVRIGFLKKLRIPPHVSDALLGNPGYLTNLPHFIHSYESGKWNQVFSFLIALGLDKNW